MATAVDGSAMLREIADTISRHRFRFANERELQDGVEQVLRDAGLPYSREVILSGSDRIDFMVGDIGLELKIKGTRAAVAAQLMRYAEQPSISALLLVTTSAALRLPATKSNGKPISTLYLNPLL